MRSRSLVLLSGEASSLPEAEARALFLSQDPDSEFDTPERRVLLVESDADPFLVADRIAFSRRVGLLLEDPSEAEGLVTRKKVRLRNFDLAKKPALDPEDYLRGSTAEVNLESPDFEFTLVRGEQDYLALTMPGRMNQSWSLRRPRARAFFHPSAVFPKLARAVVNLSRCNIGDVFLDPFAGTGSFAIEASLVGAEVVAMDLAERMARGSLANMGSFSQEWLGVVRADALRPPLKKVDAIATDVPYGRASSTMGRGGREVLLGALAAATGLLRSPSRAVVMHSKADQVEGTSELAVDEEHDLQVHKRLTRTITVFRRR